MTSDSSDTRCDLCGQSCTETQSNLLACTYKNCEGGMYHQECLEKFLKSNRLEKMSRTPLASVCQDFCKQRNKNSPERDEQELLLSWCNLPVHNKRCGSEVDADLHGKRVVIHTSHNQLFSQDHVPLSLRDQPP